MAQQNRFMIRNDLSKPLTLNIEPEGSFFPLGNGEEVSVIEVFTAAPNPDLDSSLARKQRRARLDANVSPEESPLQPPSWNCWRGPLVRRRVAW